MNIDPDKQQYVTHILTHYLELPDTPARASRLDHRLAEQLCDQGVSLQTIEAAMLLATARRLARNPQWPPLEPIRSLHYFLPIIAEVIEQPLPQSYLDYLRRKISPLTPQR